MATATKIVYSHISQDPAVRGGRPCIDSTRVAVVDLVSLHKQGRTVEQMLVVYPDLNLAQVHAALSYYYEHSQEIEAELGEDDGWDEEHERLRAEHLPNGTAT
jgi:uncharacterized protein (DUF433 family)